MEGTRFPISHYDLSDELILRGQPLPQTPHCEDEDSERNVSYIQEVVGYTDKRAVGA